MAQSITDENFQTQILDHKGVAMVDFWAPWCGPCKALGPLIDEMSEDYENNDTVVIGKYNTDEGGAVAEELGVMSIPCVKFWKNGEYQGEIIGLNDIDVYEDKITELLEN